MCVSIFMTYPLVCFLYKDVYLHILKCLIFDYTAFAKIYTLYSVHSFNVFLILKVGQKLYMFMFNNHTDYK